MKSRHPAANSPALAIVDDVGAIVAIAWYCTYRSGIHPTIAGAVGGIGFTVSLFITGVAFADDALQSQAKTGILVGSLVAALLGAAILSRTTPPR